MSVSGVEAAGFSPYVAPRIDGASASRGSAAAQSSGVDFGDLIRDGVDRLEQVQKQSDSLAVKAATGDLQSIHDYTIAASQAAVTTQVTVALRNKAVDAFTEIMRMQV